MAEITRQGIIPWMGEEDEDETLAAASTWLYDQLANIRTVLSDRRDKWTNYIKMYKATPKQSVKTFPWPGCANVYMPELHSRVRSIVNSILNGILGQRPAFLARGLVKETRESADNIAEFIDFYTRMVQKQPDYWRKYLGYWALLGTQVTKMTKGPKGNGWGPGWPVVNLTGIPLHRFVCRPGEQDVPSATLIGDYSYVPLRTVREWFEGGWISKDCFDSVVSATEQTGSQNDVFMADYYSDTGSIPPRMTLVADIYTYWAVKPGYEVPYRMVWFESANRVGWIEEWAPEDRPYTVIPFIPDETSIFGIGAGDLAGSLQDALNTNINQGIDNATIANTRVWAAGPQAQLEEGTSIYPGKVIKVDPSQVKAFALGDIYTSHFANQRMLMSGFDRTLVNENFMGLDSSVMRSRQTGMGQAMNIQGMMIRQSDYVLEFERGVIDIVWATIKMLADTENPQPLTGDFYNTENQEQDFGTLLSVIEGSDTLSDLKSVLEATLEKEEAEQVITILFDSKEVYENRAMIELKLAKSADNQQVERQTAMVMSQLVNQYIDRITQFAAQIAQLKGKPGFDIVVKTLTEGWKASNRMMKNVLSKYSVEDAAGLLISLQEVENGLGQLTAGTNTSPEPNKELPTGEGAGIEGGSSTLNPGQFSGVQGTLGGSAGGRPEGS